MGLESKSSQQIRQRSRTPIEEYNLNQISIAQNWVEKEREEITTELQAFEEFEERVEAITTNRPKLSAPPRVTPIESTGENANPMAQIRTAYRQSVMDVEHYERVYDESLTTNMTAELGPDLVNGIRAGADVAFTPEFKQALLQVIQQVSQERASFLEMLDEEANSLTDSYTALSDTVEMLSTCVNDNPPGENTTLSSCSAIVNRIDAAVRDRQQILHTRSLPNRTNGHDFCEYLYHEEDWVYPVLHAAASLRQEVETVQ